MIEMRMDQDESFRNAIITWLQANGIDTANVLRGRRATVADGNLTIEMVVTDEHGNYQSDPGYPNQLAEHTVTVPIKVPPTADVQLWLDPRCPTCGR